jgi:hypothetical protein
MQNPSLFESLEKIANAGHCSAGLSLGNALCYALALAQATANATVSDSDSAEAKQAAAHVQQVMRETRTRLFGIAEADGQAIAAMVRLRETGQPLKGYELLCDGPLQMAEAGISAVHTLQDFRAHVAERGRDDLDMAITLACGATRGAAQLLDSNMRIWPLPELLATYNPHVDRLYVAIDALTPKARIRPV